MLESLFNIVASLKIWRPAILLKGDYNTSVFLWILQNFLEHFFTEQNDYNMAAEYQ